MNKSELIDVVAGSADITKTKAEKAVNAVLQTITDSLAAEDTVVLTGFGKFAAVRTKERLGRNPITGAEITIPAGIRPKFYAGETLKNAVKQEGK
jgi:DNA-binding protein HU-beta